MNGLILGCTLMALAAGSPSEFSDYGKALEAARRQEKLLVVVLYQGSQARAIPVGQSASLLRQHFVVCRIDVETPSGAQLAKAFRRSRFPHVAVIDAREMVILQRHAGPLDTRTVHGLVARWAASTLSSGPVTSGPAICFT